RRPGGRCRGGAGGGRAGAATAGGGEPAVSTTDRTARHLQLLTDTVTAVTSSLDLAEGQPVMIAAQAHLDPRFVSFPNLPEDEYESILAVPVLARDRLEGALNVRTRLPRAFGDDEVALLSAIAGQVGQAIENAKLYERAQRRVSELESLAVQEIHHRVKNNLQTVASLLRLQARSLDNEQAGKALSESVNRILSIAAVHDLLT